MLLKTNASKCCCNCLWWWRYSCSASKGGYTGIDAVIDKDMTSSLLARNIDASVLLILTTVPKVLINYKKENEEEISTMTIEEAQNI